METRQSPTALMMARASLTAHGSSIGRGFSTGFFFGSPALHAAGGGGLSRFAFCLLLFWGCVRFAVSHDITSLTGCGVIRAGSGAHSPGRPAISWPPRGQIGAMFKVPAGRSITAPVSPARTACLSTSSADRPGGPFQLPGPRPSQRLLIYLPSGSPPG